MTSTLLAVATPMHMIAPVNAGTDKGVCVANSIQTIPASAAGKAETMTSRIDPGLEIDDDQQVDQHDRPGEAQDQPRKGGVHRLYLTTQRHRRALGTIMLGRFQDFLDVARHRAQIAALCRRVDVKGGLHRIMA